MHLIRQLFLRQSLTSYSNFGLLSVLCLYHPLISKYSKLQMDYLLSGLQDQGKAWAMYNKIFSSLSKLFVINLAVSPS